MNSYDSVCCCRHVICHYEDIQRCNVCAVMITTMISVFSFSLVLRLAVFVLASLAKGIEENIFKPSPINSLSFNRQQHNACVICTTTFHLFFFFSSRENFSTEAKNHGSYSMLLTTNVQHARYTWIAITLGRYGFCDRTDFYVVG